MATRFRLNQFASPDERERKARDVLLLHPNWDIVIQLICRAGVVAGEGSTGGARAKTGCMVSAGKRVAITVSRMFSTGKISIRVQVLGLAAILGAHLVCLWDEYRGERMSASCPRLATCVRLALSARLAELRWGEARQALERGREVALVAVPDAEGDFGQWCVGFREVLSCAFDSQLAHEIAGGVQW